MGIMVTFGSYMPKKADLEKSVTQVEIFDTGVDFLDFFDFISNVS